MEAHWDELNALLTELPSSQTVMDLLKSLDAPCLPIEIGVDADMLRSTYLYCKEVRARYTILQMIWDLGLLEPLADQVIASLSVIQKRSRQAR